MDLDELARVVHDDFAVGDLRRVRERPFELLLAHPVGCDPGRLLGVSRGVEEADGAQDAVAGVDELVAAEARQLAQAEEEAVLA